MFIILCFFILFREGALRLHLQVMISVTSGCLSCKALSHKSWKPKTQILDLILQKFTVMVFVLWDSYGTVEQRQLLLPELTSMVFSSPLAFSCSNCMRQVRWRHGIGLGLCDEAWLSCQNISTVDFSMTYATYIFWLQELLASYCLTEPSSGSDAASLQVLFFSLCKFWYPTSICRTPSLLPFTFFTCIRLWVHVPHSGTFLGCWGFTQHLLQSTHLWMSDENSLGKCADGLPYNGSLQTTARQEEGSTDYILNGEKVKSLIIKVTEGNSLFLAEVDHCKGKKRKF